MKTSIDDAKNWNKINSAFSYLPKSIKIRVNYIFFWGYIDSSLISGRCVTSYCMNASRVDLV